MGDRDAIQRSILPIPDAQHVGLTTFDANDPDTKFPKIEQLRPPKGAPNVLIVLIDDVGFGASSAFGGPCHTPNAERLAQNGLKFNRFHTTALCSPTRQALLTGRNHHSVSMGGICEIATSAPGYSSVLPKNKAPLAMTLKLNGYSTAQFGKCHEVPVWETSAMGPFNQWPTGGGGFEYFYGFVGGETDQWYPGLYEGTTPIRPGKTPEEGYHFTEDMTNKAIGWVRQQKALMPDKPFFMYFAPGATHAPHHVPKEWIDKYKGKFDGGWDRLRKEIFARQLKLGVIPANAVLTERPAEIPAFDDMPEALKPILAREMEIYAGFLEHTDHHVGRLFDALKDLEVLDDTLIYYIFGDNGASAEGTPNGCFNEIAVLNGMGTIETPEFLMSKIDDFGGPEASNHYAVGWAHATNTPYQWTKQVASHFGGTRNGTIVHWPKGIKAKGEVRSQFSHVIDIAPTVLEAAGIPAPAVVNGIQQAPFEGASMLYAFDDAKYNVLPLDGRLFERFNPDLAGRPQLIKGKTQMLFGGMSRLSEGSIVNTHSKSYSLTAEIEVPKSGANGVIVAVGGVTGGWSFYAKNGKLKHCYNFFGINQFFAESTQPIPEGKHQVRMEFKYDGGMAKGGLVSLYVDGKKDGEGRVEQTVPMVFGTETCDIGEDACAPVSSDYDANQFSGQVNWVQIDLEKDDHDHLISPDERFRVAMARQ
jgi:arylsulfatase A-like enzyme